MACSLYIVFKGDIRFETVRPRVLKAISGVLIG